MDRSISSSIFLECLSLGYCRRHDLQTGYSKLEVVFGCVGIKQSRTAKRSGEISERWVDDLHFCGIFIWNDNDRLDTEQVESDFTRVELEQGFESDDRKRFLEKHDCGKYDLEAIFLPER